MAKYDIVVIGTGSAATTVAMRCRKAGKHVAVVDSRPFGGTCALRGCDPKKVLVGSAEVIDWDGRMKEHGIHAKEVQIEWRRLMDFKRSLIKDVPRNRIGTFHGRAKFVGPTALQVGNDALDAANVVIASGSRPGDLNIPGAEHVVPSEQFLELERLAQCIVFIGGGYISFEFAHIAARAGIRATILHRGPRPLDRFDPGLVDRLAHRSRELGIDIYLGADVASISHCPSCFDVHVWMDNGDARFRPVSRCMAPGACLR
jgi:glutathione reductase (NADPH)